MVIIQLHIVISNNLHKTSGTMPRDLNATVELWGIQIYSDNTVIALLT